MSGNLRLFMAAGAAGATGALAMYALLGLGAAPASAPRAAPPRPMALDAEAPPQVARAEWDALRAELEALRGDLERLRAAPRVPASHAAAAPELRADTSVDADGDDGAGVTPHEALVRYVASFRDGGDGIEYYRLIVQAHVTALVPELLSYVGDPAELPRLRVALVGLVGDGRLRGRSAVLSTLGAALSEPDDAKLAVAVGLALTHVCGPAQVAWLEQRWSLSTHMKVRALLLDHLVSLAGDDPNPLLARALVAALDDDARLLVIGRLSASQPGSAVDAFDAVRGFAQPVRLAGAQRVHEFRAPSVVALVAAWRVSEPDDEVRRALGVAADAFGELPPYHPEQATGPPNVKDLSADVPEAWAPAAADGGAEWLEVDFANPAPAVALRVHETCRSGAIREVVLIFDDGTRDVAWRGAGSRATPGAFEVALTPGRPVRGARLVLDTARVAGWNEIDAVELVSRGSTQWASGARASSAYGQGQGRRKLLGDAELKGLSIR